MNYKEIAEDLLKEDAYYELNATELVNSEALKDRDRQEILEILESEELPKCIFNGFERVLQDIEKILEEEEYIEFIEDLSHIITTPEQYKDSDEIILLQQFFGLSDETLRKIYALGYSYYAEQNYDHATDILQLLTALNPYPSDFWYTLACCYRAKDEKAEEEKALKTAVVANPENVPAQLMLIECLLDEKKTDEAKAHHDLLKQIIIENPELEKEWAETVNN